MIGLARLVTGAGGGHGPSLNFNFVDGSAFSSQITFTRASTATYFNSAGTLTSAAINEPRFDYNPTTLAARGLLIEEQRTNSIRNNTMQGAVAGTPGTLPTNWVSTTAGGLTREIVGTGTTNGITYIDFRYTGTPSAVTAMAIQPEANTGVAALQNQTWAGSMWVALIGGTLTNIASMSVGFAERDSGGTGITSGTGTTFTPTTTFTRQIYTRTLTSASTAFYTISLRFGFVDTVTPVDITLRIGLPQLEQGAFATSVIPTTTTALTRSADVASVNTLSPWFNASEGTLYAEFNIPSALTSGSGPRLFTLQGTGGAAVDEMPLFVVQATGKAASFNAFTGGVNAGRMDASPAFVANTIIKAAATYATNARAVTAGGAVPTTSATVFTIPTITVARLGAQDAFGNSVLNGYLRRITYYPRKLSSAELQAITA